MDIKQFVTELEQFERSLTSVYNELDSGVVDNLQSEIESLRDSLRDVESTIDDWSNQLDEVRDEFNSLKDAFRELEVEAPKTPEIVLMSDWQMQQKKTFVRVNQNNKELLSSMLKMDPQSFWVVVASCMVEDPFHCSDLADFVVNYEQYIK